MHTLDFLGSFDRTLCPAKYNYGQTLANLSGNCPLSECYQEHCNRYFSLIYIYIYVFECIGSLPCVISFYFYDTYSNVKFLYLSYTYFSYSSCHCLHKIWTFQTCLHNGDEMGRQMLVCHSWLPRALMLPVLTHQRMFWAA